MPNDKHDRYEEEIREILNRMDNFIPEGSQRPVPPRQPSSPPWNGWTMNLRRRLYEYDSNSLLVGWVLLALAGALLHRIYPPFGALAALASVGCLLLAILLPMISRDFGVPERRWRGRVIDYQPARIRRPFSWRYTWWRIKSFFRLR